MFHTLRPKYQSFLWASLGTESCAVLRAVLSAALVLVLKRAEKSRKKDWLH